MGGVVKKVAKVAKPVGSLLFGKQQDPLRADPMSAQVRETHSKALAMQKGILKDLEKMDTSKLIKSAAEKQRAAALGAASDARRRLQENLARRGMGRSSLALTADKGITEGLGKRFVEIERAQPGEQFGMLARRSGIVNPIAQSTKFNMQMRDVKRGKKGGLAPVLGAGVGAMFGGAQGAGAGMQIGQGLKGVFS